MGQVLDKIPLLGETHCIIADFRGRCKGRGTGGSPTFEEQYRALHDTETYWTADKVLAAGDRFRVFIAAEGQRLLGYLDVDYAYEENEPYTLWVNEEYTGQGYEEALLAAAAAATAPNRMIAFIDADDAAMNKIYRAAGFAPVEGQNHIYAAYHT